MDSVRTGEALQVAWDHEPGSFRQLFSKVPLSRGVSSRTRRRSTLLPGTLEILLSAGEARPARVRRGTRAGRSLLGPVRLGPERKLRTSDDVVVDAGESAPRPNQTGAVSATPASRWIRAPSSESRSSMRS